MKRVILFCLLISGEVLTIFSGQPVFAQTENAQIPNNKFGIHLTMPSEEDLRDTADLVNSSGGQWGYVTLVVQENDRDQGKWQNVFDQMRRLHLIPIVRLATSLESSSWRRPSRDDVQNWADFLDSLNWVVKDRYVVLFNEPNRADEWGGIVDPESYGQVALEFAQKLKERNPDFFVMLAGFDAASPHKLPNYEDEEIFLRQMLDSLGGSKIFDYLDGWASHSYPNHGFVGSPWGEGRNSIRTYLWELELLRALGVKENLPVFITETGWPHAEGKSYEPSLYSETEVAANLRIYFKQLINDPKVVAITPFVLNYQDEPFDHFSWRKMGNGKSYYSQYEVVRSLEKIKGSPGQEQKLKIQSPPPQKVITESTYTIPLRIKNEGQAIWSPKEGYRLVLIGPQSAVFEHFFSDFSELSPFGEETLWLYLKTGQNLGEFDLSLLVTKDGQAVSNEERWSLEIIPAVNVSFELSLFPKRNSTGNDFKLLIYNDKEEVVFERNGVEVKDGKGKIQEVKNLAIGQKYRVVILKPHYLPRQGFLTVKEKENEVVFERMLPLDFNSDGKFSLGDSWTLITHPKLFSLFWPW